MKSCYLDIDGVLANFVSAAFALHGKSIPWKDVDWNFYKKLGLTEKEFWEPLGYDFWVNLPLTVEAMEVVDIVTKSFGKDNIVLLTSPCDTKGCVDGKLDWVQRHFPQFRRQMFIGGNKYLIGYRDALLVDDSEENCKKFRRVGDVYIFPRPWNSQSYLENVACQDFQDFVRHYTRTF